MQNPTRKPNRLPSDIYAQQGTFYVTVCTQNRRRILSDLCVGDGSPVPQETPIGKCVTECIAQISIHFPSVLVDSYVVMPDHVHILLTFSKQTGTGDPSPTLGKVMGWWKYQTTKAVHAQTGSESGSLWQRSYYDHVIRCEQDFLEITQYIQSNPVRWLEKNT